jgi:hypothetical protein
MLNKRKALEGPELIPRGGELIVSFFDFGAKSCLTAIGQLGPKSGSAAARPHLSRSCQ